MANPNTYNYKILSLFKNNNMKLPASVTQKIQDKTGHFLPNCAGNLNTGEKLADRPAAIGRILPNLNNAYFMLKPFYENLYQQETYKFINKGVVLVNGQLSDADKKEALNCFYFHIKNLKRDITCYEYEQQDKTLVWRTVVDTDNPMGDYYEFLSKNLFDERGIPKKDHNGTPLQAIKDEYRKASFNYVLKAYGSHENFRAKITRGAEVKARVKINCFPFAMQPQHGEFYLKFETSGQSSSIPIIVEKITELEAYIQQVENSGNSFDIQKIIFCLKTEIHKAASKKYPVTSLTWWDTAIYHNPINSNNLLANPNNFLLLNTK